MLLRYFYDERLAQASYLVGCVATGEALVVDPNRNIAPYLQEAEKEGLRITHITETHIHADFVSGSRELAAATGATAADTAAVEAASGTDTAAAADDKGTEAMLSSLPDSVSEAPAAAEAEAPAKSPKRPVRGALERATKRIASAIGGARSGATAGGSASADAGSAGADGDS